MTSKDDLTPRDRDFLAACSLVQAKGLYPSTRNFKDHTAFRLNGWERIGAIRGRLVECGALVITTAPGQGRERGGLLTREAHARLVELTLERPTLDARAIHARFDAEFAGRWGWLAILGWVNRVRDRQRQVAARGGPDEPDDPAEIRGAIDDAHRAAAAANAARIERCERRRARLARLDRATPAEAAEAILDEWRRTFAPRQAAGARAPAEEFTLAAYGNRRPRSRRASRAKSSTVRQRHVPHGAEPGVA